MVGDAALVEVVTCGGDVVVVVEAVVVRIVLRGGVGTGVVVVVVGVVVGIENRVVVGVGGLVVGMVAGRGVEVVVEGVVEGFAKFLAVTNSVGLLGFGRGLRVLSLLRLLKKVIRALISTSWGLILLRTLNPLKPSSLLLLLLLLLLTGMSAIPLSRLLLSLLTGKAVVVGRRVGLAVTAAVGVMLLSVSSEPATQKPGNL